ncbi:MAG: hypothetical protein C0404_09590 [Verrucomicrobia bacterium]|nr:hypothetical protein [Verrucomicrobiota bacterium]
MRRMLCMVSLTVFCLAMVSLLVGCENGGDDETMNKYAGTYSCTVAGDDSGTFTAVVDNAGRLTASGRSNAVGNTTATGTVTSNGDLQFGVASSGATFSGKISDDGKVSGTWQNGGNSGTFSGKKQ